MRCNGSRIPDPGSRTPTRNDLRLYRRLVDQHDRDVVLDRIHALALSTFERRAVLDELDLGLAVRAGEYLDQELLEILACPNCKTKVELVKNGTALKCGQCKRVYPIKDDIPVMLIDEATIEP